MKIVAVMACHNRRRKTLECLQRFFEQARGPEVELGVVLLDDGSTDGTAEAVMDKFPHTVVLSGDGNHFWCGGMRLAWARAAECDPDHYLLLNDDTMLDPQALEELMALVGSASTEVIGVASIRDPDSGRASYGGISEGGHPMPPTGRAEACATFNANAVLVPRGVWQKLGIFHDAYTHGMGDFDYGYEAGRHGVQILQTPNFVGSCPRNSIKGTWRDRSLGRRERWQKLHGVKGLPFREWVIYNHRNSGMIWPWRAISPSIRVILGR